MRILYVDDNRAYHKNDLLEEELKRLGYEIVHADHFNVKQARNVDVVWVEMATTNAMLASQAHFSAPLVVRLSAMEIYRKMHRIEWSRVDRFLVEGQHLKDYFLDYWERPMHPKNIRIFPTGVNMPEFPLRQGGRNRRLAVVSQVHWRKGSQLVPDVLLAIPDSYRIDFIGKYVDHDCKNYLQWEIERLVLGDRYAHTRFVWPRSKLVRWMHERTYLLHLSYTEGLSRAVNEAMACGLMPLIHKYRGVEAQYPAEYIWYDVEDLPAMLEREYKPQEYRAFIEEHYSLTRAGQRADALLKELVG